MGNSGKLIILFALLPVLFALFAITPAYALGVSVTPAELKIEASAGQESVARMRVENPSKDVALFEVYPDDLENLISISPSSFTLESNEEKEVLVKVNAGETGQFLTTFSVVGRLLADNQFQAGSGVKIPLTITVNSATSGLASALETLTAGPWIALVTLVILISWGMYRFIYTERLR